MEKGNFQRDPKVHASKSFCVSTFVHTQREWLPSLPFQLASKDSLYQLWSVLDLFIRWMIFSPNQDRYWRKCRAPNEGSPCKGVDLNRNFDVEQWGSTYLQLHGVKSMKDYSAGSKVFGLVVGKYGNDDASASPQGRTLCFLKQHGLSTKRLTTENEFSLHVELAWCFLPEIEA